jgi:hypothetical protein
MLPTPKVSARLVADGADVTASDLQYDPVRDWRHELSIMRQMTAAPGRYMFWPNPTA